jgi:hypothetical protein
MLQDMDHLEASCVIDVKVGTHDQLEQSQICVLTETTLGIAMLTAQHYIIFSIYFLRHPGDCIRQT